MNKVYNEWIKINVELNNKLEILKDLAKKRTE